MTAMVDVLAKKLTEKCKARFEVHRRPIHATKSPWKAAKGYTLSATMSGHTYHFQGGRPVKLQEMTKWLALINDMVGFGFFERRNY